MKQINFFSQNKLVNTIAQGTCFKSSFFQAISHTRITQAKPKNYKVKSKNHFPHLDCNNTKKTNVNSFCMLAEILNVCMHLCGKDIDSIYLWSFIFAKISLFTIGILHDALKKIRSQYMLNPYYQDYIGSDYICL